MKKSYILIIAGIVAAVAFHYANHSSLRYKYIASESLQNFSKGVLSKDVAKVSDAFREYLTDQAAITLQVHMVSAAQPQGSPAADQVFTKPDFFTFIENVFYSLEDYGATVSMKDFYLERGQKAAAFMFTVSSWGNTHLAYGDVHTDTRENAEALCKAHVIFTNDEPAMFDKMECDVKVTSTPRLAP